MKNRILSALIILFTFSYTYSQITNTRKWRKTEKDSLDNALLLYEEKNYLLALPEIEAIHRNHPKEEFIKYLFGKCALSRSDKQDDAYAVLSEIYAKNKKVENIQYDLARAAHYTYKLDEALDLVNAHLENKRTTPESKKEAELLKQYINYAKLYTANPSKAKILDIGPVVNTVDDEFSPAITADESVLIFTAKGQRSMGGRMNAFLEPDINGSYTEDVYMSVKKDDNYTTPVSLENINTKAHDAAVSLSADGQVLFVYRDNSDDHGDLYQSYLIGENYSTPVKLRGQVNTYSWEGHCSVSPDGQTLFFSSERGGGYGGKDIYKATLQADSTWGNIVNLGDSVNTKYDDDAPFIHPDGVTLYFSSKGRTSMGGYDIFRSTMGLDSTFKKTENVGFPINSTDDDIYFVLSGDGNHGYYSSAKKGGYGLKDIYVIETNFPPPALLLVKGKTTLSDKAVETKINVEVRSANNRVFKTFSSNSSSGQYLVSLPAGGEYKITYTYKDSPAQTLTLSSVNLAGFTEKIHNVNFDVLKDTVKPVITPTVAATPTAAVETNTAVVATETFVAKTKIQQKTMDYMDRFGDITAEGLVFRVQIAAFKFPKNYVYKHLKGLGKVEGVLLEDGITRIVIGDKFKTMRKAFEHNKKVIAAGQQDAFVTAIYKGKRVYLEQLVAMGIFVVK